MIGYILTIFFPEQCRGCKKNGNALCILCKERLLAAKPIKEPGYCFALYNYGDSVVRQAVWELKYNRKSSLAKALVQYSAKKLQDYVNAIAQHTNAQNIVLVPTPQHYTKTFHRGFNQSLLIARWIKSVVPAVTIQKLLKKSKATNSQAHTRNRLERQKNLQGSMSVKDSGSMRPDTLYIVIDDVITTGSTVSETSRALRAAGAYYIYAIALAH